MKFLTRAIGIAAAWLLTASIAMAATLLPPGEQQFFDNNGQPLAGGSVYTYVPGTTVNKATWTNSGQTNFNTNPIILDSAGRAIIYGSGSYRQIVKDQTGNLIWDQITADTSASSSSWGGTSTGTANNQLVTATNFTSADGQSISFIAGATNTGAFVLNPNNTGPINVLKDTSSGPVSLTGGEIVLGNQVTVVYDATAGAFHLVTPPINSTPSFTSVTVSGSSSFGGAIRATGSIAPTTLTTTTNNWNPTGLSGASIIQASSNSAIQITGLVAQPVGTIISLQNVGSFTIQLVPNSSLSTAANQFALPRAELIQPGQAVLLRYDATALAWKLFQGTTSMVLPTGLKRQTVESGPTDASLGTPTFLPATSASRNLTTQNISASNPLIVSAASGFSLNGAADSVCQITSNITWSSLTASNTSYLYLTVNPDGSCTPGATTTAPTYISGTAIATTSGQYTFDTVRYQMWLGNGSGVTQQTVVFVGEAVVGTTTITSTAAYAYQRRYHYEDTGNLPAAGSPVSQPANLGIHSGNSGFTTSIGVHIIVASGTLPVGAYAYIPWCLVSANAIPMQSYTDGMTVTWLACSSSAWAFSGVATASASGRYILDAGTIW